MEKHIIPELGDIRLDKLDPRHLELLYAKKLHGSRKDGQIGGLAPRTVRYIHSIMRASLKQAVRYGLVQRNVAEAVKAPRVERKEMKTLTAEEVQALLRALKSDRLYALLRLALATGMRRGELLGLRWQDIDFDGKHLMVMQQLVRTPSGQIVIQSPKTAKSKRTIPLSDETLRVLREHRLK